MDVVDILIQNGSVILTAAHISVTLEIYSPNIIVTPGTVLTILYSLSDYRLLARACLQAVSVIKS